MEPLKSILLKDLLKNKTDYVLKGKANPKIMGLCSHSKKIKPQEIYVALIGKKFDGRDFIDEAIKGGASAIITDIHNPLIDSKIPQIITSDTQKLGMELALDFYKRPKFLAAVTGTNGKTTITYLLKQLLDKSMLPCGLVGTCVLDTLLYQIKAELTTPDGIFFSQILNDAVKGGAKCVACEVSSHALDQKRLNGIKFDTVIFSNLTHDHLDYHKTMDAYFEAKSKLFTEAYAPKQGGVAVVNLDDPRSTALIEKTKRAVITYSIRDKKADLYLENLTMTQAGLKGQLHYQGESFDLFSPLFGEFNASNLLAAIGAALSFECKIKDLLLISGRLKGAPGRLDQVRQNVFIDYAHTPDGIRKILECVKKMPFSKVHILFGCGGNRDPEKRPVMGKIAEELADSIILTSDNPRFEDPNSIIEEIKKGISDHSKTKTIIDRKEAIEFALSCLKDDECLILAGKGHEKTQIIGGFTKEFDEHKMVLEFSRADK